MHGEKYFCWFQSRRFKFLLYIVTSGDDIFQLKSLALLLLSSSLVTNDFDTSNACRFNNETKLTSTRFLVLR